MIHSMTFDAFLNLIQLIDVILQVAVIDKGSYYLHPALGGCFGEGCKVAFGYGEHLNLSFIKENQKQNFSRVCWG